MIYIPPGCTANARQFTINRATIDVSAQLDSIYVRHDNFNYKLFLGHFAEQDKQPDFYDEVRAFLGNHSDLSHRSVNLRTVADIARWHSHLREVEASSKWKMPTITEILYNGATAIVATLVFALIVYLLFKSVGCFWKSDTGKTIRALRGEDVYTYTCGTCGAVNSDTESDTGLFGTFRRGWTRVRGHSPTAPPAELVPLGARANLPPNRGYRESRRIAANQPDGRSHRHRDHRRTRDRAIPRYNHRAGNAGMPVGIARQIDDAIGRIHDACDPGAFPHPVSFPSSDSAMPIREPAPLPRYTQVIAQRDEADGSNPSNTPDELGLSYEPSALETELRTVRVIRDN